jgi:hypothetical protein
MGARVEPLGEATTHLVAEDAGSPVFAVRPHPYLPSMALTRSRRPRAGCRSCTRRGSATRTPRGRAGRTSTSTPCVPLRLPASAWLTRQQTGTGYRLLARLQLEISGRDAHIAGTLAVQVPPFPPLLSAPMLTRRAGAADARGRGARAARARAARAARRARRPARGPPGGHGRGGRAHQ